IWTKADGSLLFERWVVTKNGLEIRLVACAACHARAHAGGAVLWGVAQGRPPAGFRDLTPFRLPQERDGDPLPVRVCRFFTVPWRPDPRIEKLGDPVQGAALLSQLQESRIPETAARTHSSPYYTTKTPDLNILQYSRYIDATATHRLRGPEDVARYSALVTGTDP